MDDIKILSQLYEEYSGEQPSSISALSGGGSGRRYYRLSGTIKDSGESSGYIGVVGASARDYRSFISLSKLFGDRGIKVPQVLISSDKNCAYLQQDLGSVSLFDLITKGDDTKNIARIIADSVRELARLQETPENLWGPLAGYAPFDRRQVIWDLNYFKYEYLLPSGINFDENALEDDFEKFSSEIYRNSVDLSGFMYRDCQSRNIMICNGSPWWIDFQGGRKGPGVYDLVSLLWQAKADFSDEFRNQMIDIYLNEKQQLSSSPIYKDFETFNKIVNLYAIFRTLQVLGAYGLRGLVERKAHFIESIPFALNNLKNLLKKGVCDDYPELKTVCEAACMDSRFRNAGHKGLRIEVFSFSYKKGYPNDFSGNGGGFMFDCRGMHNPGRYEEYKKLTGKDKPVIDFLESHGEVQKFVDNAFALVEGTIRNYIDRGFSNLQIGFGCTGGHHRSVYCAERMANLLRIKFSETDVILTHREHQN